MSEREMERIRSILEETYVYDMYVVHDRTDLSGGFHPSFLMLRPEIDGRTGLTRDVAWLDPCEASSRHPKALEPGTTFAFPLIDVAGEAAMAKVLVVRDGEPVFTDYVMLYRVDGAWRIVGKLYHSHQTSIC